MCDRYGILHGILKITQITHVKRKNRRGNGRDNTIRFILFAFVFNECCWTISLLCMCVLRAGLFGVIVVFVRCRVCVFEAYCVARPESKESCSRATAAEPHSLGAHSAPLSPQQQLNRESDQSKRAQQQ